MSTAAAQSDKPPSGPTGVAVKAASAAKAVGAKTQKVVEAADSKASAAAKKSTTVARESSRRKLTDPKTMRALAHPIRIALLEALLREGPLTATAAATMLDDSPGNMSWHLNVLAKYGFVEEAEGGRGRARPWRLVNLGTEFVEQADDPELSTAAVTMSRVIVDRNRDRAQAWLDEQSSYAPKWRKAAFSSNAVAYVTAEEMAEISDEMQQVMNKYRDRTFDKEKRPKGSKPVVITAFGHPIHPSPTGN
jgi:DNA-binding transcriptional ArsR family regulator